MPNGYAVRSTRVDGKQQIVWLHREILGLKRTDSREADHINRDRLDNRRANLRVATRFQNRQNLASMGGSSKHRGVSWDKRSGKWRAQAGLSGRKHFIGYFKTEQEAADAAARFREQNMPYSEEASA